MYPQASAQQMVPMNDSYGTFSIPPYTLEGSQTPLTPFTATSNGPWFDSTVSNRATKRFGYTYAGLNDWNSTVEARQSLAVTLMQQMYSPNVYGKRDSVVRSSLPSTREWFVALSVNKFDLRGQSFNILLYIGSNTTSPLATSSSTVGTFPVFAPPIALNTAGLLPQLTAFAEFSLGRWVVDNGEVDVPAWLRKELQWAVTKADGSLVDLSDVPSLNVTVHEQSRAGGATAASLPVWGGKVVYPGVTMGKLGGYHL